MHKVAKIAPDRPDVKIKNHGLGQYGAEPHYSTLPFWQLCALNGYSHITKKMFCEHSLISAEYCQEELERRRL